MDSTKPNGQGKRYAPYKKFIGSMVPNWIMRRNDICHGAKLTFGRLAQYAGKHEQAFPGHQALSDELGVSVAAVKGYLRELHNLGVIESQRMGSGNHNLYFFVYREGVVEFKTDRPKAICQPIPFDGEETIHQRPTDGYRATPTDGDNSTFPSNKRKRIRRESEENQKKNQKKNQTLHATYDSTSQYSDRAKRVITVWHQVTTPAVGLGFLPIDRFSTIVEKAIDRCPDPETARKLFESVVEGERKRPTNLRKSIVRILMGYSPYDEPLNDCPGEDDCDAEIPF